MRRLPALLFAAFLALSACSDAFEPFTEAEQTFALYGFLDARRDTQFVRLQPISRNVDAASARVTSTDLESGETVVWADTSITAEDGSEATIFYALFRPLPARRYRLVAEPRERERTTTEAIVWVPAEAVLDTEQPTVIDMTVAQRLSLSAGAEVQAVQVLYTAQVVEDGRLVGETERVAVAYPTSQSGTGGRTLVVALSRDAGQVRATLGVPPDDSTGAALLDLAVAYAVIEREQAPVSGGVGATGAAAAFETSWTLDSTFVQQIGLVDRQDAARR